MPSLPFSPNSFETFGDLLKYLRRREHLTQLELSIAVGYSEAQIGRLEKDQRRPDLTTIKASFIPALHLENEPDFIARFLELALSTPQEDAPAPGIPPYKGLLFFEESEAELFFGRETLTAHLAERVSGLASGSPLRFLAVVGASGSGKSSLVRAGLAVKLKEAGWEVRIFTPGANPVETLETQIEPEKGKTEPDRLLLVDQFEEVFTACHNESERAAFIEKLFELAQESAGKVIVVIALRADFYSHCAQYPILRQAVAANQEYIGQMTAEELRRVIEQPAKRGGWELEPGLVDLLLHDIGAYDTGAPEPGALPLLSHALLATWELRRGRKFTLEGYHAAGGVRGAIAETAESVFTDQLNQAQQELAREIFLRLTELGEGTEDTRRRAALNELVRQSTQATQLMGVLNTLAEARLITLNADSAEVAHEALIREWQRLHEWLTQDRDGLQLHRHLTEAAHEWELLARDPGALYRGSRLGQAREWEEQHPTTLNVGEKSFLDASNEWEQLEAKEREVQQQRELEVAQKLAETEKQSLIRLRGRNRVITVIGSIAVIMAIVAGAFGVQSNRNANIAQAASTQAIADFADSEAQRLAAEANSIRLADGDTNLSALLAIQSLRMKYTPSGDGALTSLTTLQAPPREFKSNTDEIWEIAISPDGKYVITGGKDTIVRLWDFATGEVVRTFSGHTAPIGGLGLSADGKYLVTGGSGDYTARLWDVATGQTLKVFKVPTPEIYFAAISPDARNIVTTARGEVRVWDVASGQTVHVFSGGDGNQMFWRVYYSPDGKYILAGSEWGNAYVWDAVTWEQIQVFQHPEGVGGVAISPDGKTFATACDDHKVRLWDIVTGQLIREFLGHSDQLNEIKFSPNGQYLLSGGLDRISRLWDVATGKTLRLFGGNKAAVQTVAFTPDGKYVLTAGNDGVVQVWSLQSSPGGTVFSGHSYAVRKASFSPDGKLVVTASDDRTVRIWDVASGQTLTTLVGHTAQVTDAIFSLDGKLVLTGSQDKTARLWDAATGKEIRRFDGHTDELSKVLFSQDGKTIITTSYDGTARVWDTQTGKTILIYTNQNQGQIVRAVFSPDGKTVATTGTDRTARIWDPKTGKDLMVFKGHTDKVTGVAFSPDGKNLLTVSWDGTARLWDVATGKEIRQFVGHTDSLYGADFSPDGKYIVTSGVDRTARLWDVQTGQELRRFAGHTDEVRYVVFSPDGKYILTSSDDGTARLWLTNLDDTIRAVCFLLTRGLTPDERTQFGISDQKPTCPVP